MRFRILYLLVGCFFVATAQCTGEPSIPPSRCPGPVPAFALAIRAADQRSLSKQTKVEVAFGGTGKEMFDLSNPPNAPQVVFCHVVPNNTDLDGGPIDASLANTKAIQEVSCLLWTDGAADLTVTSQGLAPQKRTLQAHSNECGVVTSDVEIKLHPLNDLDAGE